MMIIIQSTNICWSWVCRTIQRWKFPWTLFITRPCFITTHFIYTSILKNKHDIWKKKVFHMCQSHVCQKCTRSKGDINIRQYQAITALKKIFFFTIGATSVIFWIIFFWNTTVTSPKDGLPLATFLVLMAVYTTRLLASWKFFGVYFGPVNSLLFVERRVRSWKEIKIRSTCSNHSKKKKKSKWNT